MQGGFKQEEVCQALNLATLCVLQERLGAKHCYSVTDVI